MKNLCYLPALAALLAAAPAARAQQPWQPFRAGVVYQYSETGTPGDTTHTLQVGPGAAVAGTPDTVYRFNRRAPKTNVSRYRAGGNPSFELVADNLFGATLRVRPGAVFVLTAANGRTLTLRPRAPLGQNWALGPAGLTAHVMSRGVAQVLGQPDSVAWLMLSDGQDIRLSKRFGLVAGPSPDSYLNGRNRRRALALTGHTGNAANPVQVGPAAAFDFQPGNVFQRLRETRAVGNSRCSATWTQDSVLTRALNPARDSVVYTVRVRQVYRGYGQAGAPAMFCSATGSSYQAYTRRLAVPVAPTAGSTVLTNAFLAEFPLAVAGQRGQVVGPAVRSPRYLNRPEWTQGSCNLPSGTGADSARLQQILDYGRVVSYAQGLGATRTFTQSFDNTDDENLVAYRKGPETWGTFFSFRQLLAARAVRPAASTAAFPQPFAESLSVKFDLARPQPVALALRDGLGRTVLTRPAAVLPAGPQQLALDTKNLPAGVYTLHINLPAEGRSEVLKVVRE